MTNNLKKRMAIVLIISMVFSNAGMMTLATSVDDMASTIVNVSGDDYSHLYNQGDGIGANGGDDAAHIVHGDDNGLSGDGAGASDGAGQSDPVGMKLSEPADEEPEEGDDAGASDPVGASIASPEEGGGDVGASDPEGASIASPEEGGDGVEAKLSEPAATNSDIETSEEQEEEEDNGAEDKVENNTNISTKSTTIDDTDDIKEKIASESDANENKFENLSLNISTKSETINVASESTTINIASDSDIFGSEVIVETKDNNLFGSGEVYYIYADWTAGNKTPDADITAVTILPYGYATPSTYDKAWDIQRSNGLKGYKVGTELFIHAPEDKEIRFPSESKEVFYGFSNLTVINNLDKVSCPEVFNMIRMFGGCKKLKKIDLSNVKAGWYVYLEGTFQDCESLTEIIGLEKFNFRQVPTMLSAFENCKSLKEINFGKIDLGGTATYLAKAFKNCTNLTNIYVSKNPDLSSVTWSDDMFTGCYNLRGGKYSKFTDYGSDLKYAKIDEGPEDPGYFTSARSFLMKDWYKPCMENYDNANITEIEFMNYGEVKPTGADFEWRLPRSYGLIGYRFGSKIYIYKESDFDIHLEENAMKTFSNYDTANYFTNLTSIKNFKLVYSDMAMELPGLFEGASSLTEIDLSSFDTYRFYSVQRMFKDCSSLATIKVSDKFDLSDVNYSNTTDMFAGCVSLVGKNIDGTPGTDAESSYSESNPKNKTLAKIEENYGDKHGYLTDGNYRLSKDWNKDINDVTKINKSDVTKLSYTYKKPSSGEKYEIKNSNGLFAYIVNTSEVVIYAKNERNIYTAVDASELFKNMTSLVNITNFELVKTRKAENMASMFENCNQLPSFDLSSFDTLRVTNMAKMFKSLRSLANIDLKNFKTAKVTTFEESFADMDALLDINISDFDTSSATNFSKAFEGSANIKSIDIGKFTVPQTANISNMFKDLPNLENIYCNNSFTVDATDIVFDNCPKLVGDKGTKFSVVGAKDDTYARLDGGVLSPGYFSKPIYKIVRGWYLGSEIEPSQITKLTILKSTDPIDPSAYSYPYDVPNSNGLRGYVNAVQKEITIYAPSEGDITFGFDASYVFSGETEKFTSLTAIEGLYNTSTKVTENMSYMFDGATSLKALDVYNFETQKCTNMSYMFNGCASLETIKAYVDFVVTQVTSSDNMFNGCVNLIGKDMDGNPSTNPSSIYSETNPKDKTLAIIEKDYDTATDTHGYLSDGSYRLAAGWYYAYGTKDASWSPNNITKIVFASTSSMKPTDYDHTWNIPGGNGLVGYRKGQVVTIYADKTYPIYAAKNSSGLFANRVNNFYDASFGWNSGGCEFEDLHLLDTSKVTSFFAAFKNVQFPSGTMSFNGFDTKGVEDFSNMFSSSSDNVTRGSTVGDNPWSSWLGRNENVELDLSSFYLGDAVSLNGLLYNSGYKKVTFADDINTSKVTSIRGMFAHAYNLESIYSLYLNTSSVDPIEMEYLFIGCKKLKTLDLSSFDTTNITSYKGLFVNCTALEKVYVSDNFKEISGGSDHVFNGCNILTGEEGSTKASIAGLTSEADSNKDTYARIDKDKSDANSAGLLSDGNYVLKPGWFRSANEAGNFRHQDITTIKFVPFGEATMSNPDYVWEIPDSYHLMACRKDGDIEIYRNQDRTIYAYKDSTQLFSNAGSYSRDIGYRGGMNILTSITNLNLLNTSKVATMSGMFAGATQLTSLDVSNFDTSKVKKMDLMFHYMLELTSLNLSNFDTSKVTDMYCMFSFDHNLSSLDISNFDTSRVTDMGYMFGRVGNSLGTNYASIVGIDKFDTSNVTNMKSMFYSSHLTGPSLNFESFDTSKVTNMETMFWDMKTDTTILGLGSFDTSNVTNFNEMLRGVEVTTIYASDTFVVNGTATSENMFSGASNLVGEKGTSHSAAGVNDGSYARIDEGSTNPGYFTTDHYILSPNWYDGLGAIISDVQYIKITPYTEALPENPISSRILPNSGGLKVYYYMTSSNEPTLRIHLSRDKEIYTAANASYLFSGPTDDTKFSSLKSFTNLNYLNTIEATNMSHMFDGATKVTEIDLSNFETFDVTDTSYMFYNCQKLVKIKASDNFDVTNVTNSYYMFKNCYDIKSYTIDGVKVPYFGYMDDVVDKTAANISVVGIRNGYLSDINYMFDASSRYYNEWAKSVGLNMRQVTKLTFTYDKNDIPANIEAEGSFWSMQGLRVYKTNGTEVVIYAKQRRPIYVSAYADYGFSRGRWASIQEINGIEYLDFTKIEEATKLFEGWKYIPIDLSNTNFRGLDYADGMFSGVPDLSIFNFDGIKMPRVYRVTGMFEYTGDISELAENEVIDLSTVEIGRTSYCNLQDMSGWFAGRSKTKKIILPENCYSQNVTTMGSMFKDCESLEEIVWNNLDTTDVRDMSRMFMNCKKYKTLDLTILSSDDLTNMEEMFRGCDELETIYASKEFDVSDVTKSNNAFKDCDSLFGGSGTSCAAMKVSDPSDYHNKKYAHIDLGTTSIRPGYFTFKTYFLNNNWYQSTYDRRDIEEISILKFGDATPSTPDEDWAIPNSNGLRACRSGNSIFIYPPSDIALNAARDISYLFSGETAETKFTGLKKIISFENLNTNTATNMSHMFDGAINLSTVSFAKIDTINVTDMGYMFDNVKEMTLLDLTRFDTQNVTNMAGMFRNCERLVTIKATDLFVTTNVTSDTNIFQGDLSLTGEEGTSYGTALVDSKEYARIDRADSEGLPGYFTLNNIHEHKICGIHWAMDCEHSLNKHGEDAKLYAKMPVGLDENYVKDYINGTSAIGESSPYMYLDDDLGDISITLTRDVYICLNGHNCGLRFEPSNYKAYITNCKHKVAHIASTSTIHNYYAKDAKVEIYGITQKSGINYYSNIQFNDLSTNTFYNCKDSYVYNVDVVDAAYDKFINYDNTYAGSADAIAFEEVSVEETLNSLGGLDQVFINNSSSIAKVSMIECDYSGKVNPGTSDVRPGRPVKGFINIDGGGELNIRKYFEVFGVDCVTGYPLVNVTNGSTYRIMENPDPEGLTYRNSLFGTDVDYKTLFNLDGGLFEVGTYSEISIHSTEIKRNNNMDQSILNLCGESNIFGELDVDVNAFTYAVGPALSTISVIHSGTNSIKIGGDRINIPDSNQVFVGAGWESDESQDQNVLGIYSDIDDYNTPLFTQVPGTRFYVLSTIKNIGFKHDKFVGYIIKNWNSETAAHPGFYSYNFTADTSKRSSLCVKEINENGQNNIVITDFYTVSFTSTVSIAEKYLVPQTVRYRGTVSEVLPKPYTKTLDFIDWCYEDETGTERVFDFEHFLVEDDMTVYAKWSGHRFRVVFDGDVGLFPGNLPRATVTEVYGELIQYPANPYKDGLRFVGYKLGSDTSYIPGGTPKYYNFDEVKTFTAYYEPWTYTITFDENAPVSPAGLPNVVNGNMDDVTDAKSTIAKTLPNNNYTLAGYSFIGWATASYTAPEAENLRDTHSDKIIPNAGSVTFIYNEAAQIRTLYALWVRNKYTIHMVTNANSYIGDPYAADGYVLYDTKLATATRSDGTRLFENNKNRPGYPAFTNKWTTYQIADAYDRKMVNTYGTYVDNTADGGTSLAPQIYIQNKYLDGNSYYRNGSDMNIYPLWVNTEYNLNLDIRENGKIEGFTNPIPFTGYFDAPYYTKGDDTEPKDGSAFKVPVSTVSGIEFKYWSSDESGNNKMDANTLFMNIAYSTIYANYGAPSPGGDTPGGGGGYIPSGGGGSSGGGGGGGKGSAFPVNMNVKIIPGVFVIKDVLNGSAGNWVYDVLSDKWKYNAYNKNNEEIKVLDGFYIIDNIAYEDVNGTKVPRVTQDTYYFDSNEYLYTGWIQTSDNKWYFLDTDRGVNSGRLCYGWKYISGSWYFFNISDGSMLTSALTPDGFWVGDDGKWIQ